MIRPATPDSDSRLMHERIGRPLAVSTSIVPAAHSRKTRIRNCAEAWPDRMNIAAAALRWRNP